MTPLAEHLKLKQQCQFDFSFNLVQKDRAEVLYNTYGDLYFCLLLSQKIYTNSLRHF